MGVSSKFGIKIGDKEIYHIESREQALELIKTVVNQFMGESFTTYQPKCPICDSKLSDHEKNMNKPVGECTNHECDSTIYAADYFGKILDILAEVDKTNFATEKVTSKDTKKSLSLDYDLDDDEDAYYDWDQDVTKGTGIVAAKRKHHKSTTTGKTSEFTEIIDGEVVFIY